MTSFEGLLSKLACAFDQAGIGYMIIGGQAVLIHGEPRQTQDIDVTLAVDHGKVGEVERILSAIGFKSIPEDPAALARQTNVLPVKDSETGLRVDIVFSDLPYERQAVGRAIPVEIGRQLVRFISAEDLIIYKLVAGRPLDRQDARGIWLRKGKALDVAYIERWLAQFAALSGLEGILDSWRQTRR